MDNIKRFTCPACGYPLLEAPPCSEGVSSLEICPSCFYQPGYDDVPDASGHDTSPTVWREQWVAPGNALDI
jgi:hypothetical protein